MKKTPPSPRPMMPAAAARIQSTQARANGGAVKAGTFAPRAQPPVTSRLLWLPDTAPTRISTAP